MTWTPEQRRVWNERNPGREREIKRDYQRDYSARNKDALRERARENYDPGLQRAAILRSRHGYGPEDWAALWDAQDGRCYLCGDQMSVKQAVVDHDHSHCPAGRTCHVCRRGLAHAGCNSAIGYANDDPGRLRQLADTLEAAQLAVERRKAAGDQIRLFADDEISR